MLKYNKLSFVLLLLSTSWAASASANSPWVNEQGSGSLTLSYGEQTADEFYAGDMRMDLPVDLDLQTVALDFSYGLTDALSLDVQLIRASSDFAVDPVLAPEGGLSGFGDARIGLRYAFYNQDGGAFTIKGAAIIEGDYDTGAITAIGDGGSGFELSALAGKQFDSGFFLSGELGYRERGNSVPEEVFGGVTAGFTFNESNSIYLGYKTVDANGDLDIGAAGFSPARFPEVDEDYDLVSGGFNARFSDALGAGIAYGKKIDGRNTAKSDFWNLSVSYSF